MPINASAGSSKPRQLPPAGTHIARCYQIVDLGTQHWEYANKPKSGRKVRISWELPLEKADFGEGEEPFAVHRKYTLSLGDKATLRGDLEAWRGRPFTEAELLSFDVLKVLGAACMVTVMHDTKGDNTYANVTTVTAVPKGMQVPEPINPQFSYSIDDDGKGPKYGQLPEFLQKEIAASDEFKRPAVDETDTIPMDDDDSNDPPF